MLIHKNKAAFSTTTRILSCEPCGPSDRPSVAEAGNRGLWWQRHTPSWPPDHGRAPLRGPGRSAESCRNPRRMHPYPDQRLEGYSRSYHAAVETRAGGLLQRESGESDGACAPSWGCLGQTCLLEALPLLPSKCFPGELGGLPQPAGLAPFKDKGNWQLWRPEGWPDGPQNCL